MSIDSLVAVVAAKPTAKPYLTPAMTVQELLTFFSAAILLCLIISLLTLAIVQLFRPYMRGSSQRMMFRRWRDAWEFEHISRAGPETFPIPPSLRPLIEEFDEFAAFGADDEDIEPEGCVPLAAASNTSTPARSSGCGCDRNFTVCVHAMERSNAC